MKDNGNVWWNHHQGGFGTRPSGFFIKKAKRIN